ncbi:MAG: hypothetical protein ACRC40_03835, partial [Fusobacteriaceae bacterium]
MKRAIETIKKMLRDSRVKTLLSLFFVFVGIVVAGVMNLGYSVALILSLVLKPTFHIEEVKFLEYGKIVGKNVELVYENQKIVIAPNLYIEYDIKGPFKDWLKKIIVEKPDVLIERKGSEVNIVKAFSNGGGTEKAGIGVPIGVVEVREANLTFKDNSYELPIEKKLKNVEGYVRFDKIEGINLCFSGEENKEKIVYSFNNRIESYEMNIILQNIEINTSLLQYGYYYEPIQYREGEVDLDLTISPRGLEGTANLKNAKIEYFDFLEPAKNVNGKVDFLGKKIVVKADFELFAQKRKFDLEFDFEKGMDGKIELGKISGSQLQNYRLLKNIPLHKTPINIKNLGISLKLDDKKNFSLGVDYIFSDFNVGPLKLKNSSGSLLYSDSSVVFHFFKGEANLNEMNKKIDISGKLKDNQMKINYKIDKFLGKADLIFTDENLKISSEKGIF